jgi:MarR-like DNA-binding transcriptional regulator SgrR of sgrS sRNA
VDQNIDLTRYQILRKSLKYGDSRSWQETWEQLLESGSIIPLLIHTSWIAYRKDIQELKSDAAGVPDFADCWLLGP